MHNFAVTECTAVVAILVGWSASIVHCARECRILCKGDQSGP